MTVIDAPFATPTDDKQREGLVGLLKLSFTYNGAIILAVPTILTLSGKSFPHSQWLYANIGGALGGLILSVIGLIVLNMYVHDREEWIPLSSYNIARNCCLTGLGVATVCAVIFAAGIFADQDVGLGLLFIPLGLVTAVYLLGMVAELYRRHRRAQRTAEATPADEPKPTLGE